MYSTMWKKKKIIPHNQNQERPIYSQTTPQPHTFSLIFLTESLSSIFCRHAWLVKNFSQRAVTDSKCEISEAVKMMRWPVPQLVFWLCISFYCRCRPRDLLFHSLLGIQGRKVLYERLGSRPDLVRYLGIDTEAVNSRLLS